MALKIPVVMTNGQLEQLQSSDLISGSLVTQGTWDHGLLVGLSDDDHTQYALLAGRAVPVTTLYGSTQAGGTLNLVGTSHATKGVVSLASDLLFLNQATGVISVYGSSVERLRITDAGVLTTYDGSSNLLWTMNAAGTLKYQDAAAVTQFSVIGQALFIGATIEVGIDPASSGTGSIITMWTGTTPPAAAADRVKLYGKDFAAGDARLYVQAESGSTVIIGGSSVIAASHIGGTASGGDVILQSTTHATRGKIKFDTYGYVDSTDISFYKPTTSTQVAGFNAGSNGGTVWVMDSAGAVQFAASGIYSTQAKCGVFVGAQGTGDGAIVIGLTNLLTTGSGYIAYQQARVQPAAQSDYVSHYAKDKSAGHSCLYVQGETGNPIIIGDAQVEADTFKSDVATGTQPYACTSTTVNTNLNADLLDGQEGAWYEGPFPAINGFRLTLVSGDPVPTADQTAKTTIYCTPYLNNRIALYDGSNWLLRSSAEFSLALGTLSNATNYDVFCYDNSGTPTLEFLAWTDATTRATGLVQQDGVWVKSGATTRRYLGTFRTTATTTTEDSVTNRFLWNFSNRVSKRINLPGSSANTHTYTSSTWRKFNNSDANSTVFAVIGLGGTVGVQGGGDVYGCAGAATGDARMGVSVSNVSTDATPPLNQGLSQTANNTGASVPMSKILPIGLVYFRNVQGVFVGTGNYSFARIEGHFPG